jgi:hypothetical protein
MPIAFPVLIADVQVRGGIDVYYESANPTINQGASCNRPAKDELPAKRVAYFCQSAHSTISIRDLVTELRVGPESQLLYCTWSWGRKEMSTLAEEV